MKKEATAEEVAAAAHAMEELQEQQDYERASQGTNKIFSTSKPKVRFDTNSFIRKKLLIRNHRESCDE